MICDVICDVICCDMINRSKDIPISCHFYFLFLFSIVVDRWIIVFICLRVPMKRTVPDASSRASQATQLVPQQQPLAHNISKLVVTN
jgi:hypothetical protein